MPKSARILIPNTPHHVVQRGHNRQTVFVGNDDFDYYRENIIFFKQEFGSKISAYCQMTNHIHLIIIPGDNPELFSQLMMRVTGRQTWYVNKLEKRTCSLWEGRFKSSIVSTLEYLPACCRYIELNPVRANLVVNPGTTNGQVSIVWLMAKEILLPISVLVINPLGEMALKDKRHGRHMFSIPLLITS